jgi:hypothetical protein
MSFAAIAPPPGLLLLSWSALLLLFVPADPLDDC